MRKTGWLSAATLVVLSACNPFDDAMVLVFERSMRDQPSLDPYENPIAPPEGSVPFAAGNYPAADGDVGLGQAEMMGDVPPRFDQADVTFQRPVVVNLVNPVQVTPESLGRGEVMYLRTCAPCHGPDGSGTTGYIVPAGYPPFPLITDQVRAFPDGYIYGIIRTGRGLMPAYGHQVGNYDRWHIVNYVRQLQMEAAGGAEGASGSPDQE